MLSGKEAKAAGSAEPVSTPWFIVHVVIVHIAIVHVTIEEWLIQ